MTSVHTYSKQTVWIIITGQKALEEPSLRCKQQHTHVFEGTERRNKQLGQSLGMKY